jgi:hypothetical protein
MEKMPHQRNFPIRHPQWLAIMDENVVPHGCI